MLFIFFFFSSRRRHTRYWRDWSSDVCSSDLFDSGRYEVVMWYTKTESKRDTYTFNLDAVRTPAKYPGKKHFKGPKAGQFSGNPLGKNPEDVWNIPNVKSNHIEKTGHPGQFPVRLIERLV